MRQIVSGVAGLRRIPKRTIASSCRRGLNFNTQYPHPRTTVIPTQRFGAGLRIITDLAAPADSRMIAVPGQSGNPLSPHFSDMVQRWRQFEWLVPGRAEPVAILTLEPLR
jgi:acyl-homoserine lactone acylase PvdQ